MKKQFAAIFAATAVLGVTTAFAANPFSDVTPDSWAYQSVSQLASTGIINGYPDGTFKGQNNITRYEMAQMVAKAMANQDRANAEQQAMINRLADEFASELNNLGVRVAALENKVGNVKVTGDVRLRYKGSENNDGQYAYGKSSKFDMRGRVQFNAMVNENTDATIRLTSSDYEFGDSEAGDAEIDRVYVTHRFGDNVKVTAGRYNQVIGAGLAYDDTFDGVNAVIGNEKLSLEAAHGYMVDGVIKDHGLDTDENASMTYLALKGKVGEATTVGGFWLNVNKNFDYKADKAYLDDEAYGFNVDANFGKVWVGGEWIDVKDADDSSAWVAGIGYGAYNASKAGTWDVKAQYFDQDTNAPIISSTWNQAYDLGSGVNGYKGWMATVDYALQNNVGLSAYYGFSSEDQDGNDLGDFYRAEVNYKF